MKKPIIYQMLPRLWGNNVAKPVMNGDIFQNGTGKFCNIDSATIDYLKDMGVSHIWFTGIIRHATLCNTCGCEASDSDWVKGSAGSPYSITDYFDVNPYLAEVPENRMHEFEAMIERTHSKGLKVIMDFVPNHVARDYGKFSPKPIVKGRDAMGHPVLGAEDDKSQLWLESNDFFYYPGQELVLPVEKQEYKEFPAMASGNSYTPTPSVNDWYDTIKINYCDYHTATWDKMYEAVRFWTEKGVDGFRCDMVELVPKQFLKWLIAKIKEDFPDIVFIAEAYQKESYSSYIRDIGFDYLYDKSGLYDALFDIVRKNVDDSGVPVEPWQSTRRITGNWQSLGDLQPYMLNFLENHDEVRFASDFFGLDAKKSFAALYVSLFFNTAPFMLYFGEEIGEKGMDSEGFSGKNGRTSIFDWWSVGSIRRLYNTIHGKDELDEREKSVLQVFRTALRFASKDPAMNSGDTYDLCYCNHSSDGFNKDRHFAFLRDYQDETWLVAVNFSDKIADVSLTIPEHAFEWLKIQKTKELNECNPIKVHIEPMNGVLLRIC